ncbi:ABC transporter ATP-binding protein [Streptomyces yokosukanensis]|uniref:ABC transporter ATP-binding protein n=1 Tax=Streptomyces yokosukanensis TaxID=67386 RepID=A0A101P3B2_9ACTN|nr:ATP-binding cassette domain-containing protein [Streptomyces yokosukanensis]KUN04148.1 ABC transporter ATP-binding protein [Streptomyces yokosukanensis]
MDGVDVKAEGLGLKGPRGWAFRGITLDAEPGSLIAIEGPSGSGRTSLLLALTGRMKPTEGAAGVGGFALPRHMARLRRISAVANVAGVTDLEPALTVGEHLRERALLQSRFGDSLRALLRPRAQRAHEARLRVDAALAAAGLDLESLPKGSRTAVRDLERPQEVRLSIALALLGGPGLLGVDDVDLKLSDAERAELWDLLRSLARAGTTVAVVCRTAPGDCVVVTTGPQGAAARAGTGAVRDGGTRGAERAGTDEDDDKSHPEEDVDALA